MVRSCVRRRRAKRSAHASPDSPLLLQAAFAADWARSGVASWVTDHFGAEHVEPLRVCLLDHFAVIKDVFAYCAAATCDMRAGGSAFALGWQAFKVPARLSGHVCASVRATHSPLRAAQTLLSEWGVPDKRGCSALDVEHIVIAASGSRATERRAGMARHDFLAALARVAVHKFVMSRRVRPCVRRRPHACAALTLVAPGGAPGHRGPHAHAAARAASRAACASVTVPRLAPAQQTGARLDCRAARLATGTSCGRMHAWQLDDYFSRHGATLRAVFRMYCHHGGGSLALPGWLLLLREAGLLLQGTPLSAARARLCFVLSKTTLVR